MKLKGNAEVKIKFAPIPTKPPVPEIPAHERFALYRIAYSTPVYTGLTWGNSGPVYPELVGYHEFESHAIAEVEAIIPRVHSNVMLAIYDRHTQHWILNELWYGDRGKP